MELLAWWAMWVGVAYVVGGLVLWGWRMVKRNIEMPEAED